MAFTLETDRLRLREFTLADTAFTLELINEPAWHEFIGDRGLRTEDGAQEYLEQAILGSYQRHGFGLYHVALSVDDTPVGMCGLVRRDVLDAPDLGFAILERHWRRGYAFEASAAVLAHAREQLGLDPILAVTNRANARSIALLEKLGFRPDGTARLTEDADESALFTTASEA
ncbi:MAG: GNAT family N-acetyltransferase [Acidobacteriota bacterium]